MWFVFFYCVVTFSTSRFWALGTVCWESRCLSGLSNTMETVIHKLCRGVLGAAIALAVFIAAGAVYAWEAHGAVIAGAYSVSAPAVWPIAARAQQSARIPRIGLLMGYAESDPTAQPFVAAFVQCL